MSRDNSPERTPKALICLQCGGKTCELSAQNCRECNSIICSACFMIQIGCGFDKRGKICQACFNGVYQQQRHYCNDEMCTCTHKSAKVLIVLQREREQFEYLKRTLNVDAWKKLHVPIDYASAHHGKYLIELFFSNDPSEHGYIKWLVGAADPAKTARYNVNSSPAFASFIREARELLAMVKKVKLDIS